MSSHQSNISVFGLVSLEIMRPQHDIFGSATEFEPFWPFWTRFNIVSPEFSRSLVRNEKNLNFGLGCAGIAIFWGSSKLAAIAGFMRGQSVIPYQT